MARIRMSASSDSRCAGVTEACATSTGVEALRRCANPAAAAGPAAARALGHVLLLSLGRLLEAGHDVGVLVDLVSGSTVAGASVRPTHELLQEAVRVFSEARLNVAAPVYVARDSGDTTDAGGGDAGDGAGGGAGTDMPPVLAVDVMLVALLARPDVRWRMVGLHQQRTRDAGHSILRHNAAGGGGADNAGLSPDHVTALVSVAGALATVYVHCVSGTRVVPRLTCAVNVNP